MLMSIPSISNKTALRSVKCSTQPSRIQILCGTLILLTDTDLVVFNLFYSRMCYRWQCGRCLLHWLLYRANNCKRTFRLQYNQQLHAPRGGLEHPEPGDPCRRCLVWPTRREYYRNNQCNW